MSGGVVLLVDDDSSVRRAIIRAAGAGIEWVEAATVESARIILADDSIRVLGAIIDVQLPDGSGTELAVQIRQRDPAAPVLLMSGHAAVEPSHVAYASDVAYVAKPCPTSVVKEFVRRVERRRATDASRAEGVYLLARRHALLTSQVRLLLPLLRPLSRAQVASELGISENTLKTRVRDLLARVGCKNMREVEQAIEALASNHLRGDTLMG